MFLEKNLNLGSEEKVSLWRKTAAATYSMSGDCQVYCLQSVDVSRALDFIEEKDKGWTLTHLAGKAAALTVREIPEINRVIRFGKFYPRKDISIFFQAALDKEGAELSGHTVRNVDGLSLDEIKKDLNQAVARMRGGDDFHYKKAKRMLGLLPALIRKPLINLLGFAMYGLNVWSPAFGAPKDAFGSMMISNIGNLGLQTGFAPLVPYSRCPLILTLGAVYDKVVADQGEIKIQKTVDCCWTSDHRLIDGVVGAKFTQAFKYFMEHPEKLDI